MRLAATFQLQASACQEDTASSTPPNPLRVPQLSCTSSRRRTSRTARSSLPSCPSRIHRGARDALVARLVEPMADHFPSEIRSPQSTPFHLARQAAQGEARGHMKASWTSASDLLHSFPRTIKREGVVLPTSDQCCIDRSANLLVTEGEDCARKIATLEAALQRKQWCLSRRHAFNLPLATEATRRVVARLEVRTQSQDSVRESRVP